MRSVKAGTFIGELSYVGTRTAIGMATIVNTGAIVEHDCVVGDGCHVAPGASIAGGCHLGDGVTIWSGAIVRDHISVASGVIVGAGAVVCRGPDEAGDLRRGSGPPHEAARMSPPGMISPPRRPTPWTLRASHYLDLVTALTIKEIKARYKRTYLGYAWSLLNPLVYAVTYWVAFKAILNVKIEGYFLFLLAGLFPWQWLNNSLTSAPNAFVANAPLVKKIAFPRYLIVVSSVVTEGLHFLLCLPVLALLAVLFGRAVVSPAWVWGPLVLLAIQGVATVWFRAGHRVVQRLLSRHRTPAWPRHDCAVLCDAGHLRAADGAADVSAAHRIQPVHAHRRSVAVPAAQRDAGLGVGRHGRARGAHCCGRGSGHLRSTAVEVRRGTLMESPIIEFEQVGKKYSLALHRGGGIKNLVLNFPSALRHMRAGDREVLADFRSPSDAANRSRCWAATGRARARSSHWSPA